MRVSRSGLLARSVALAGLALAAGLGLAMAAASPWVVPPGQSIGGGIAAALATSEALEPTRLDLTLINDAGEVVDAADLVQRPTFLFYFSATCPHCVQVAPELERLAKRLAGRFDVLGIASGSNDLALLSQFARETGSSFPIWKDYSRKYASANGMTATPTLRLVRLTGPARAEGFETLAAWSPFPAGGSLLAEMRARTLLGEDPWQAFEAGRYWGPSACGSCHTTEYESWGLTHHSVAYWTLYERQKAEDDSCVGCHVTALGEKTGFRKGDHGSALADVTCEACHTAGGPHDGDRAKASREAARASCVRCHDAEHSVKFDLARALPAVDHWSAARVDDATLLNLREDLLAGRAPRPLLAFPEGKVLGAASCAGCHEKETKHWRGSPHAAARGTLEAKGSGEDPACLSCHAERRVATAAAVGPAEFHE
jgi:thiol-disulfide isomerase/thioredoxin